MKIAGRLGAAVAALAAILAVGTVGYRLLAGATWFDGLYMTFITISSVGYSEVVPGLDHNPAGRVFTMALITVGMGLLVYVAGSLTAFFVEGDLSHLIRRRRMQARIDTLSDHVVLCGLDGLGGHAAAELAATSRPFVAVEPAVEVVERVASRVDLLFVVGDPTQDRILEMAGITRASGVIVALPDDKDNMFVTVTARQLAPRARLVVRCGDPALRDRFLRAGADAVVLPERIGGLRIASEMIRPHVVGFLDRMLRPGAGETFRFEEVEVEPGSAAVGKALGSLRIAERVRVPVLALSGPGEHEIRYYPEASAVLHPGSRLVVLAEPAALESLRAIVREG